MVETSSVPQYWGNRTFGAGVNQHGRLGAGPFPQVGAGQAQLATSRWLARHGVEHQRWNGGMLWAGRGRTCGTRLT
jgi:hypothetical protein